MNIIKGGRELELQIKTSFYEEECKNALPFLFYKGMGEKICYATYTHQAFGGYRLEVFTRVGNSDEPKEAVLEEFFKTHKSKEVLYDSRRNKVIFDYDHLKMVDTNDWTYLFTDAFPDNLPGRDLLALSEGEIKYRAVAVFYKFFATSVYALSSGLSTLTKDLIIPTTVSKEGEKFSLHLLANLCGIDRADTVLQGNFPRAMVCPEGEPYPVDPSSLRAMERITKEFFRKNHVENSSAIIKSPHDYMVITSTQFSEMSTIPEGYVEVIINRGEFPELSEYAFINGQKLYVYPILNDEVKITAQVIAERLGLTADKVVLMDDDMHGYGFM
jgi:hypothetical protein